MTPAPGSAAEVVSTLTMEERIRLLSGRGFWQLEPVEHAGLPSITITDGPHGLRRQATDDDLFAPGSAVPATCFPTAAALGASWDEELLAEIGRAIGREAHDRNVAVVLGPGLNLKRHPAAGRNFEYFSEDPLLSGRLAAAMTRGIQSQGVGACLKHFVANNQETNRMTVDAVVDERTLRELYLRSFEIAVRDGRPWMVMSSYNRVNGTHVGESRRLLTTVLRDEWGFDGVVVSDWGATDDRAASLLAGMDLAMPGAAGAYAEEIRAGLEAGRIPSSAVDRAATRIVHLLQRTQRAAAESSGDPGDAHGLARRAAAAGTVLLTNDGTLPLTSPGRTAVIGAFAAEPRYQGAGSSRVNPTRLDTPLAALRERFGAGRIRYSAGYDATTGETSEAMLDDAAAAARDADVAVVFAGLPSAWESEGLDRRHLRLPDGHRRLIGVVADSNPRTVVVLCNGAPVETGWTGRPAAVVEAYLGGQAVGSAIVDVLTGDAEPGGRLAESVPLAQGDLPADHNFPGHPRQVEYREGLYVGYRFHHSAGVPAAFPFGHGLSYTTFAYDEVRSSGGGRPREVTVDVTNTGDRAGSEVVQVYVRPVDPAVHRPDRTLAGFVKVHLDPGETRRVAIPLEPRAFTYWDLPTRDWAVEAGTVELLVGSSSADIRAVLTVELTGTTPPRSRPRPDGFVADDDAFAAALGRGVPTPAPTRPFHRNSTVADLRHSALGRLVRHAIVGQARRQAETELAGMAESVPALAEVTIDQMPLRALAALSGGRIPPRAVDVLLALLNHRWRRAFRLLRGTLGRGQSPAR